MNDKDEATNENARKETGEMTQNESGSETLKDGDLDQVSGGMGNFEIQDLAAKKTAPSDKKPGDRGIYENVTYKY